MLLVSSNLTIKYLADQTVCLNDDFYHEHSVGGYKCSKCGATHNRLNDGWVGRCENCNNIMMNMFHYGPEPHDYPEFGPSLQTLKDAITFKRYTSLPA